jgi:hypothetical protein
MAAGMRAVGMAGAGMIAVHAGDDPSSSFGKVKAALAVQP